MSVEFLLTVLFLWIAISLFIVGLFFYLKITRGCTQKIMARVIDHSFGYGGSSPKSAHDIFEFDFNGQHYEIEDHTISRTNVGSLIPVTIDPTNPRR